MTLEELTNLSLTELLSQPPSISKALVVAMSGLYFDGGHHKQWFLEKVIEALDSDLAMVLNEFGDWKDGIAP